jgi:Fur family transcriptional regulator, ferric uptake regulator
MAARTSTTEASLQTNLHRSGRRLTPQRALIYDALCAMHGHVSADAVYQQVRKVHPSITRATVYRTLAVLRDEGLINGTDLGQGIVQFEVRGDEHHHLICQRCGAIQEIGSSAFQQLRDSLKKQHGFAARIEHFAVFGVCRACSANNH